MDAWQDAGSRPAPAASPARLVWALGATQVIGYGTLYYAFSVLAPAMGRDLGWSLEWVYGAFSAALLAGGAAAPLAGRLIDRHGAGAVMAAGSGVAALALAGTALAPERASFVLGLLAVEVASTLVLYDAAFAALVQARGDDARQRITHLTLIAGFASTLFWPLTSALHERMGWREVYLAFAALHLGVCLPLHLWVARAWPPAPAARPAAGEAPRPEEGAIGEEHRRAAFGLVVAGFCLGGFVLSALLVHMLPVLTALGLGASAALVGMLFGPAQVLSRVGSMVAGGGLSPVSVAVLASALLPAALVVLILGGDGLGGIGILGAGAFALLFGLGSGLVSIVRGTVPLALFGRAGYGERLGRITAARLVVTSLAPFVFALGLERYGVHAALWAAVGLATLAALAFARVGRLAARPAARAS